MIVKPLEENFAPYASADSVVKVIKRYRDSGLPDPISATGLEQVSVAHSMTAFVIRALVFLGLVDEGGNITEAFKQLRQAKTTEYPGVLAEIIRKAYLKVFTCADPAKHSASEIVDAFRGYEPSKQRDKMVALFMGLCQEAALAPQGTIKRRTQNAPSRKQRIPAISTDGDSGKDEETNDSSRTPPSQGDKLHAALLGLVSDLPSKGPHWTKKQRDAWLTAFTSNLDYAYPPTEEVVSTVKTAV